MAKRIAIRAHGWEDPSLWFSWGYGLLEYFQSYVSPMDAEIVLVVSPFASWSVAEKTWIFNKKHHCTIQHVCLQSYSAEAYMKVEETYAIDLHFFSGWLKLVKWLIPLTCVNIHPGPLQSPIDQQGNEWHFGGKWMRWDHVHRKVWEAYQAWVIKTSALSMHYITPKFDDPTYLIWQVEVPILESDASRENYKQRARTIEPLFQQYVCAQIAFGRIRIEDTKVIIDDDVVFPGAVFWDFVELKN